jgi:hypothetical protein
MELLDVKMKNKNLMEYNFVLYFASPWIHLKKNIPPQPMG